MFCPKCGTEGQEGQRFCKACGVNLQIVSDALGSGSDTLGQLRIDVDTITKDAKEWFKNFKTGMSGMQPKPARASTNPVEMPVKDEPEKIKDRIPKDWLSYSWQHNVKNGLMSLFSGVGLGIVLYYMGQVGLQSGMVQDIQEIARREIRGLEQILGMLWLFALIPVLKGMAQILYAAIFAESIATLTARFLPPQPVQRDFTPREFAPPNFAAINEPPTSVTEHTTQIFADAPPRQEREPQ